MNKEDIQILKQLFNGHHLETKELERAQYLCGVLTNEINSRL